MGRVVASRVMTDRMQKRRPRHEVVMAVLQPLANACVGPLARWGVNPLFVVAFHSVLGLVAAGLIAWAGPPSTQAGWPAWLVAASLLVAKAILDNADGALARSTHRVTQMGRYFDTGMDTILGVASFAALAVHASPLLAAAAYVTLVWTLSLDFNMERMYRELRSTGAPARVDMPIGAPRMLFVPFERLYRYVLAPQDRVIERSDVWLFERVSGHLWENAPLDERLAWRDLFSTAAVVNLGLSTQTVALAAALVAGRPAWYAWWVVLGGAWALSVQLLRIVRFRRYRHAR